MSSGPRSLFIRVACGDADAQIRVMMILGYRTASNKHTSIGVHTSTVVSRVGRTSDPLALGPLKASQYEETSRSLFLHHLHDDSRLLAKSHTYLQWFYENSVVNYLLRNRKVDEYSNQVPTTTTFISWTCKCLIFFSWSVWLAQWCTSPLTFVGSQV